MEHIDYHMDMAGEAEAAAAANANAQAEYELAQQHTEYAQGLHIINALADYAIQQEGGAIDALAAYITLSRIEKMAAELKGQVKDQAMTDAAKWNEKTFQYFGVEIQKKAAAGRWDFKGLKDWQAAKANLSAIEERAKAAYQQATKFGATTVTADGEEVELPTYTAGGETLAIKL
jgi:hypothetical protein